MLCFLKMRVAGEDEGSYAHLLVVLDLGQDLIRGADQRGAAAGPGAADAGPQVRFDISELVGNIAVFLA
ncbi:hypothetical protein QW131_04745 [Roseibium salinum]|nr:hypothetical protein [Roseibium salinum]